MQGHPFSAQARQERTLAWQATRVLQAQTPAQQVWQRKKTKALNPHTHPYRARAGQKRTKCQALPNQRRKALPEPPAKPDTRPCPRVPLPQTGAARQAKQGYQVTQAYSKAGQT